MTIERLVIRGAVDEHGRPRPDTELLLDVTGEHPAFLVGWEVDEEGHHLSDRKSAIDTNAIVARTPTLPPATA
jgi:hypothetical protein